MPRASTNTGFRWPPYTKKALRDLLGRVATAQGHRVKQDDLVAVLIQRAQASITSADALDELGSEIRDQRKRAQKLGY